MNLADSLLENGRLRNEYAEELKLCTDMVLSAGLATGHAETLTELMSEAMSQVEAYRDTIEKLRETNRNLNEEWHKTLEAYEKLDAEMQDKRWYPHE